MAEINIFQYSFFNAYQLVYRGFQSETILVNVKILVPHQNPQLHHFHNKSQHKAVSFFGCSALKTLTSPPEICDNSTQLVLNF